MTTSIGWKKVIDLYYLTLLRHGESEGNLAGVIQGQSDYPLTPTGREQALRLARYWKSEGVPFDSIISSPLLRASQTALIISTCLEVPIIYDPVWQERNFGQLQGKSLDEINQQIPPVDFFHPYESIGGTGESQVSLYTRAFQALQSILKMPHGFYLIISHGGILNKVLYVIMGITPQGHYNSPIFHFGNTGYAQVRFNPSSRQWAVICLNNQNGSLISEGSSFWKTD